MSSRYTIRSEARLPEFEVPGIAACAVDDREGARTTVAAFVLSPRPLYRAATLAALERLRPDHLLLPDGSAVVNWGEPGRRARAIFFERPAGRSVADAEGALTPWTEEEVRSRLLVPAVAMLQILAENGLTHRAIRVANLYYRDGARRTALLGACFLGLAAEFQPAAYETVESAAADPAGRGDGTSADDLYALGVLTLHLLLGRPPGDPSWGPDRLIEEKIRAGSYATLAGAAAFSPDMETLLRGLLHDLPAERLTARDLARWLDGKPRAVRVAERAAGGAPSAAARMIARTLAGEGAEAAERLRRPAFEAALRQALPGETAVEAVLGALAAADPEAAGPREDARLVAQIAVALDPPGPIRYRGASLLPGGFGGALAAAALAHPDLASPEVARLAEMLRARLLHWHRISQRPAPPNLAAEMAALDRLTRLLADPRPGSGIERLLYTLNPGLPCQSPPVADQAIDQPEPLLAALETAARRETVAAQPVDRHVSAFLLERWGGADERQFSKLAAAEPVTRMLGALYILARLQAATGPAATPSLARVFANQAGPALDRFHSRETRALLSDRIPDVVKSGSLVRLLSLLDSPSALAADHAGFERARREFGQIETAIAGLERRRQTLALAMRAPANAVAAAFAALAAGATVTVTLLSLLAG